MFYGKLERESRVFVKRNFVVIEPWVGKNIIVHTGNKLYRIRVAQEYLGYKVGEFLLTRSHVRKERKEKKRKKSPTMHSVAKVGGKKN